MKEIILSIQPKWCGKIANGEKTIEIRKRKPKCDVPFKVYIYQSVGKSMLIDVIKDGDVLWGSDEIYHGKTKILTCPKSLGVYGGSKKIIGEFVCDEIFQLEMSADKKTYIQISSSNGRYKAAMTMDEAKKYGRGKPLFVWHISDLVIYDEPKLLSDFGFSKAPQSYCYVRGGNNEV